MKLGRIALSALIAITLISGLSLAEDANESINDSINDTGIGPAEVSEPTVAEGSEAEMAGPEENETAPETPTGEVQSLEGSWILNVDDGQISMVLYQSENLLFGAANSEVPMPWNGVVSGEVEAGDEVELEILSLQDGVLVSTLIAGTSIEGSITGSFVQSDSQGKVNSGSVMGILTSPDTSGYEPVDVPTAVATTTTAEVTPAPAAAGNATAEETTEVGKKYTDVTTVADTITSTWTGFEI